MPSATSISQTWEFCSCVVGADNAGSSASTGSIHRASNWTRPVLGQSTVIRPSSPGATPVRVAIVSPSLLRDSDRDRWSGNRHLHRVQQCQVTPGHMRPMLPGQRRGFHSREIGRRQVLGPLPHAATIEIAGIDETIDPNRGPLRRRQFQLQHPADGVPGRRGGTRRRRPSSRSGREEGPATTVERNRLDRSRAWHSGQTGKRDTAGLRVRQIGDANLRRGLEPKSVFAGFGLLRPVMDVDGFARRKGISCRRAIHGADVELAMQLRQQLRSFGGAT